MKILILIFFPIFVFSQQENDWASTMKIAMDNINSKDFDTALINLDKSLKFSPNNPSSLYFKGYLKIIIGEQEEGCEALVDAIYFNSNSAKNLYAEKCIDLKQVNSHCKF
ncbi:hypothetical protein [Chryseobacterium sp. MFBS3-17]|uniref:hypothetical protein n=1 Tax=Chryseobacterium sp. MFBS3-17 TaxID=2886689 RepID=UPI001D0E5C35|nr:hypothetical protein [Chryseobacterium sp. MFBS3-17]MCC2589867.1 hypothetical protein [Chryseobacterium sp. MFBS3-17]